MLGELERSRLLADAASDKQCDQTSEVFKTLEVPRIALTRLGGHNAISPLHFSPCIL